VRQLVSLGMSKLINCPVRIWCLWMRRVRILR
jgi:hypothetical protein